MNASPDDIHISFASVFCTDQSEQNGLDNKHRAVMNKCLISAILC